MSVVQIKDKKPLGKLELIAIALGGMIGGGIFSILGVSVSIIGLATPLAILLGGFLAFLAAFSYAKLAFYYKDEGATYSFYKRTFPDNSFSIALTGWLISFGYISTLALYTFTFASYFSSLLPIDDKSLVQKVVSAIVLGLFSLINIKSVDGMGKIEDFLVYTKIIILLVISGLFLSKGEVSFDHFSVIKDVPFSSILMVASLTFVAYEGFQLIIHAYEDAQDPDKNIPLAIYSSIIITVILYLLLSVGALSMIPQELLIRDKEFALAAGASQILGSFGYFIVLTGALLATSSAINGTLFGASRLISVIASDGVFPNFLSKKVKKNIPQNAILFMALFAYLFILTGKLETIIEFGSITFIIVSFLMAFTNFKIRDKTNTRGILAILAMFFLELQHYLFSIMKLRQI